MDLFSSTFFLPPAFQMHLSVNIIFFFQSLKLIYKYIALMRISMFWYRQYRQFCTCRFEEKKPTKKVRNLNLITYYSTYYFLLMLFRFSNPLKYNYAFFLANLKLTSIYNGMLVSLSRNACQFVVSRTFILAQVSETISPELVHKVFLLGIEQVNRYEKSWSGSHVPFFIDHRELPIRQCFRSGSGFRDLLDPDPDPGA